MEQIFSAVSLPRASAALRAHVAAIGIALATVASVGCSSNELETAYGSQVSLHADSSVNGLGVLAEMMRRSGHDVGSAFVLSPRLRRRADVIVWAPYDYGEPSQEARDWLDAWLYERSGRTLIFIGRDYDAAADYWNDVASQASGEVKDRVASEAVSARGRFRGERMLPATATDWGWFNIDGTLKYRKVATLDGAPRWISGIDPAKTHIVLNGRISTNDADDEVLLSSEGDPIVILKDDYGARIFIVANGSFLLNYGMVNQENRKLAAKLLAELPSSQSVMFVETGSSPMVSESEPESKLPNMFAEFGSEPFFPLYFHLALVAAVACLAAWPIFGRPKDDVPTTRSDFGKHVAALGELLARSGDEGFARSRLAAYWQAAQGERRRKRWEIPAAAVGGTERAATAGDAAPVVIDAKSTSEKSPSAESPSAESPSEGRGSGDAG